VVVVLLVVEVVVVLLLVDVVDVLCVVVVVVVLYPGQLGVMMQRLPDWSPQSVDARYATTWLEQQSCGTAS
jgi:hypothetical protein